MPMQMRRLIAQAGEVYFGWIQQIAQDLFHSKNRLHKILPLRFLKIGHFLDMRIANNAAERGIVSVVNAHHS